MIMKKENKMRINVVLSYVLASIISSIIKTLSGFNYNPALDGLDLRFLISLLTLLIPFLILYYLVFDKFFLKSDKNHNK